MAFTDKEPAIRALIQALADRFGAEAFLVEDWRLDMPGAIGFTNAKDRRIYISVVTLGQLPGHYSVMVEVYRQGDSNFPFDIAVDREGLQLPELLDLFCQWESRPYPGYARA
jgi:hypothetical protein